MAGLLLLLHLLLSMSLRGGDSKRGARRGWRGVRVEDGRRVDGGQADLDGLLRHLRQGRRRRELRQGGGSGGRSRILQLQRDGDLALDRVQQDVGGWLGRSGGGSRSVL